MTVTQALLSKTLAVYQRGQVPQQPLYYRSERDKGFDSGTAQQGGWGYLTRQAPEAFTWKMTCHLDLEKMGKEDILRKIHMTKDLRVRTARNVVVTLSDRGMARGKGGRNN